MAWNYRVVRKEGELVVYGVYYDGMGSVVACDRDKNAPFGQDIEELKHNLELMIEALNKEILVYEKLENRNNG